MSTMFINTDGGSRGNPGPAAISAVFFDEKEKIIYSSKSYIGFATNNEAEYRAIIYALKILLNSNWFKNNNNIDTGRVICRLDSQLVVEQINGNYKIKEDHIKRLTAEIKKLTDRIKLNISFVHIPREENKIADKLVNQALDAEKKIDTGK